MADVEAAAVDVALTAVTMMDKIPKMTSSTAQRRRAMACYVAGLQNFDSAASKTVNED